MSKTFLLSVYNGNSGGKRIRGGLGRVAMQLGMAITVVCVLLFAVRVVLAAPTYAGPISVTANMGNFSPTAVRVANSATSSLSAYYLPPSGMPEGQLSASYDWSVSSVQYKALQADSFGSPPANSYSDSISPAQPSANSGTTLTFTPEIAGYWQVSTICSVIVTDTTTNQYWSGSANAGPVDLMSFTIDITYTGPVYNSSGDTSDAGTVVTNQQVNVHAGWPIQLGAVHVLPADVTAFTWTITGTGPNGSSAINGYVSNESTGAPVVPGNTSETGQAFVVALAPANDIKSTFPDPLSPGILNHYYYTSAGSYIASVVPEGITGIEAAKTTFSVAAPSTTLTAKYQYPAQLAPIGNGPAQWIYLQATQALTATTFASPSLAGIVFYHPFAHNQTFQGASYFVQVYTWNHAYTGLNGTQNWSTTGTGLDTSDPYGSNMVNQPVAGDDEQEDGPQITTDQFNQVNYSPIAVQDSPTMWVMYTPKFSGSIDVPLASCTWPWGGTATWNAANGTWTFTNRHPTTAGNAPTATTHTYPTWAQVLIAKNQWKPQN